MLGDMTCYHLQGEGPAEDLITYGKSYHLRFLYISDHSMCKCPGLLPKLSSITVVMRKWVIWKEWNKGTHYKDAGNKGW